jgi:uncharacterized protein YaiL (DUF2058 family)
MQNLRDKLLKAGLVSEDQATRVDAQKAPPRAAADQEPRRAAPAPRPARTEQPRRGGPPSRSDRAAGPIPKLPPLPVANNREFQRLEAKKQVELERQLRQLVTSAQLPVEPGGHTFYFVTRKNRLRRIELTDELAARLERGEVAVVERPEPAQIEHSIVPAQTALEVLALSEKAVRFFNRAEHPIGFMTDADLSARQQHEADQEAESPVPPMPRIPTATSPEPEHADEEAPEVEPPEGNEEVAARAERLAKDVPGGSDEQT